MAADVAQHESSRIKRYASAFSNILICYPSLFAENQKGSPNSDKV